MLSAFLMFILRSFQKADALNLKDFSTSFRLVFGTFNILVLLLLWVFLPLSTNLIKPFRYSGHEPFSILYTWIPSKYFIQRSMGSQVMVRLLLWCGQNVNNGYHQRLLFWHGKWNIRFKNRLCNSMWGDHFYFWFWTGLRPNGAVVWSTSK